MTMLCVLLNNNQILLFHFTLLRHITTTLEEGSSFLSKTSILAQKKTKKIKINLFSSFNC